MSGKVTFHFDDCFISHYEQAFPVFQKAGVQGCLVVAAGEGKHQMCFEQMLEMQDAGWEILSHTFNHIHMVEPIPAELAEYEVVQSKQFLEEKGFHVRQFVTPYSTCHVDMIPLLCLHYEAAFTVYTSSAGLPVEQLVIKQPLERYKFNRAVMSGHSLEELKSYIDYVAEQDAWLVFYEHDLGVGKNITAKVLAAVLEYCKEKEVEILTSSQVLERYIGKIEREQL